MSKSEIKEIKKDIQKVHKSEAKLEKDISASTLSRTQRRNLRKQVHDREQNKQQSRLVESQIVPYGKSQFFKSMKPAVYNNPPFRQMREENEISAYNMPKLTGKSIGEGNMISQPLRVKDVLSAWDLFTINRAFPGTSWSPYLNNMTVMPLPGGTFKMSRAIATCWDFDGGAFAQPGTRTYTIVISVPALTSYVGSGEGGNYFASSVRLGGFLIIQTSSLGTNLSPVYFNDTRFAQSSITAYGSDLSSFAAGGFIWGSSVHLKLISPLANLTGTVYKGTMSLSQFGSGITVQNLIQDAQVTSTNQFETTLRSSVIEPNLVADISCRVGASTLPFNEMYPDADNEILSYAVYQTPVISVTSGLPTPYTFIVSTEGNFVYYPKATDPLAFNIGQSEVKPQFQDRDMKRNPYVEGVIQPTANRTIDDTPWYHKVVNKLKSSIARIGSKLDDTYLGGMVKTGDDILFDSAIQRGLGLRNDRRNDIDDFDRQLRELQDIPISATSGYPQTNSSSSFMIEVDAPIWYSKQDMSYSWNAMVATLSSLAYTEYQSSQVAAFIQFVHTQQTWLNAQADFFQDNRVAKK